MNVEKKFLKAISDFHLVFPKDKILIAFSTGVDSSVLLHLFLKFKEYLYIDDIGLAYFNHGLRKEAEKEEEITKSIAKSFKLSAYIGKENVKLFAKQKKLSIEEAGRILRYKFFTKILQEEGFNKLATAHHLSDLVETMVLWFIQGSKNGLKGFKAREDNIIRPLVYISKDEIYKYAFENNIKFCEDKTNKDEKFLRNKVRKKIIPILKEINPSLEQSLLTLSFFLHTDEEFFSSKIEKYKSIYQDKILNVDKLKDWEDALIYRIIDKWLLENYKIKASYKQLLEILKLLKSRKNWQISIEGKKVIKEYNLMFVDYKDYYKNINYEYFIKPNESIYIKEASVIITSTLENNVNIDKLKYAKNKACFEFIPEMEKGFKIRNRKAGDRFIPFGSNTEKKLKDVLISLKIPKSERNKIPLILFQDKILWITGYRRSAFFPVKEDSKKIICFTVKEVKSADN